MVCTRQAHACVCLLVCGPTKCWWPIVLGPCGCAQISWPHAHAPGTACLEYMCKHVRGLGACLWLCRRHVQVLAGAQPTCKCQRVLSPRACLSLCLLQVHVHECASPNSRAGFNQASCIRNPYLTCTSWCCLTATKTDVKHGIPCKQDNNAR